MSDVGDAAVVATLRGGQRRALLLSGGGRYADPWHRFAGTSARLAEVLRAHDFDVDSTADVETGLAGLDNRIELLVTNVGDPSPAPPDPASILAARRGLLRYLAAGGAVLSMHASAFPDIPEWENLVGGRWIDATSMHPALGAAHIRVYPERHPIVEASTDFDLDDERYSYLRTAPGIIALASHRHEDLDHPLLWARQQGPNRVVYDALGHDTRSYESADHRAIIGRAARWLVADLP